MHRCVEQEAHEVANVPQPDTGAHPWTVMVMYLHAETATAAVIRAGWPHDLACVAVRQSSCIILSFRAGHFEKRRAEVCFHRLFLRVGTLAFVCFHVGDPVLLLVADRLRSDLGEYARVCCCTQVHEAQGLEQTARVHKDYKRACYWACQLDWYCCQYGY